ncbi:MAG: DUF5320 domain-containing protein [Desulfatirhabdiaceae bacterium]
MPRGDGTGPMGTGPMTGRAAGYCSGAGAPIARNPGYGCGFGRGMGYGGCGYGFRNIFHATGIPGRMRFGGYPGPYGYPAPFQPGMGMEKQMLKQQADGLQMELDLIRKRLDEMEAKSGPE